MSMDTFIELFSGILGTFVLTAFFLFALKMLLVIAMAI